MSAKSKTKRKNVNRSMHREISTRSTRVGEKTSFIQLLSYEVTDAPIADPTIPKEIESEMEYLHDGLQKSPIDVIERLEELIKIYPKVPVFYNFISVAYSALGDKGKTKYYTEKNYEHNPRYLFAKLNYAELCMREGNYRKVPEILEKKYDIKALYPERNVFHISEVVGFLGTAGVYFYHIEKLEQAEILCEGLRKLAPEHRYTKRLNRLLIVNTMTKGFKKLFGEKKKKIEKLDH